MFARRAALVLALAACSSITTVRVQPENVAAGPHLRAIAIVHAQITSAYILFIPIPGGVSLDRVVNQMLLPSAKLLGADKVVDVKVDITPDHGIWVLRKLLGWRSAEASGIAVVVEDESQPAPAAVQAPP
ncbi:MAG TPA: hypothetical protein VGM88_05720 [Kofleriaceae bacterium]|jgi:hypothetical protein